MKMSMLNRVMCKLGMHTYDECGEAHCKRFDKDDTLCQRCTPETVCNKFIQVNAYVCINCGKTTMVESVV